MTPKLSYTQLPSILYQHCHPESVSHPEWLLWNDELAAHLDWAGLGLSQDEWLAAISGQAVPEILTPIAMAYAGHQFGHFVPQLGDGRAVLMTEVDDAAGIRWDVHLKGSGRTMFSRQGDGRCPLGPAIREYIVSEAMHGLGIPSTRSLAVIGTGDSVYRESALPGAILVRVARGHIRVGTFEFLAARDRREELCQLLDYSLKRLYPHIEVPDETGSKTRNRGARQFLEAVCQGQAELVAQWMGVGFIHGVMNTDNMVVSCETIDFGPCAFMDTYHPNTVFSSIDRYGRYAYSEQSKIAQWNISCLANCLAMIVDESEYEPLWEVVQSFSNRFQAAWDRLRCQKIGLGVSTESLEVSDTLHNIMKDQLLDFTLTYRSLAGLLESTDIDGSAVWVDWVKRWQSLVQASDRSIKDVTETMNSVNPGVIARNHRVQHAIDAAETGDWGPCQRLLAVLQTPYSESPGWEIFQTPPTPAEVIRDTFCGT